LSTHFYRPSVSGRLPAGCRFVKSVTSRFSTDRILRGPYPPVMPAPTDFLRMVLDPIRLAVLGHAATGPVDAAELARLLDVPERKVLAALAVVRAQGLVDQNHRLVVETLREIAQALPAGAPVDPAVIEGSWSPDEIEVLGRFFEGSRLREIPVAAGKRLVVLERLVQEFEPGIRYDERTVNRVLQLFHPDYAALRRYLVDHGLLTRAEGVYWRTGGRYDLGG
jgi:hypothetical protein